MPKVANHNLVLGAVRVTVTENVGGKRKVWKYAAAQWDKMEHIIDDIDWLQLYEHSSVEQIVDPF